MHLEFVSLSQPWDWLELPLGSERKVVGSGVRKMLDGDDHGDLFFTQAEGITIEPLTNSTEEEYEDEYYDIWEGKLFNRIK